MLIALTLTSLTYPGNLLNNIRTRAEAVICWLFPFTKIYLHFILEFEKSLKSTFGVSVCAHRALGLLQFAGGHHGVNLLATQITMERSLQKQHNGKSFI